MKLSPKIISHAFKTQRVIFEKIDNDTTRYIFELSQEIKKGKVKISLDEYFNFLTSYLIYVRFFEETAEIDCKIWKKIHRNLFDKKYKMKKFCEVLQIIEFFDDDLILDLL